MIIFIVVIIIIIILLPVENLSIVAQKLQSKLQTLFGRATTLAIHHQQNHRAAKPN